MILHGMPHKRAIWEVTSNELLTTQAMRKKKFYYTHIQKYIILQLLLNIVTAGIEALVMSGNGFCMPATKKSAGCELHSLYRGGGGRTIQNKQCGMLK
jgi:hypothetical protein